jgi:nucleoside-diphosphate-sugar epimerase
MNTGTARGVSIKELVEMIQEIIGFKSEITWNTISKRPFEISKLVIDAEKMKELLNWHPKYSLEEGLQRTIDWWKKYLDRNNKG